MLHLNRIVPLLNQHKKFILFFTLGITVAAAVLVNVLPVEYKSVATISPVNIQLADKGRIFNPNIKDLYSFFGNGDDIERIESANDWNSIYRAIVKENKLADYFHINELDTNASIDKAVNILRKKLYVKPTEKGQLQIIAWAHEPDTALLWVKTFRSKINLRMRECIQLQYDSVIQQLSKSLEALTKQSIIPTEVTDSSKVATSIREMKEHSIMQLIANNITLTGEWRQARAAIPDVLTVLDEGIADKTAVRPNKLIVISGAFLAALLFGMAWVIVYHRNNLQ